MTAATGVYFRREDYASFWVRLLVDVVDFMVFGAFSLAVAIVIWMILPTNRATMNLILLVSLAAGFFYFVVVKRSQFRTLGYRVGRVRIVGLDGQAPSYSSLILRSVFGILGPLNWLDSIWLFDDRHRQTLRDKFAGTYVVKINAQPSGKGTIVYRMYEVALYNCMFREVELSVAQASPQ
jgi:uncharacterized RDD family membrane protein YckC